MAKALKYITCSLGIAVGILIVVVGIVAFSWIDYSRFGADFYTEIYHAVNVIIRCFAWMTISLGAIDIFYFTNKLIPVNFICQNHEKEENKEI